MLPCNDTLAYKAFWLCSPEKRYRAYDKNRCLKRCNVGVGSMSASTKCPASPCLREKGIFLPVSDCADDGKKRPSNACAREHCIMTNIMVMWFFDNFRACQRSIPVMTHFCRQFDSKPLRTDIVCMRASPLANPSHGGNSSSHSKRNRRHHE